MFIHAIFVHPRYYGFGAHLMESAAEYEEENPGTNYFTHLIEVGFECMNLFFAFFWFDFLNLLVCCCWLFVVCCCCGCCLLLWLLFVVVVVVVVVVVAVVLLLYCHFSSSPPSSLFLPHPLHPPVMFFSSSPLPGPRRARLDVSSRISDCNGVSYSQKGVGQCFFSSTRKSRQNKSFVHVQKHDNLLARLWQEIFIISANANEDFFKLVYFTLRAFMDDFVSFYCGVSLFSLLFVCVCLIFYFCLSFCPFLPLSFLHIVDNRSTTHGAWACSSLRWTPWTRRCRQLRVSLTEVGMKIVDGLSLCLCVCC